MATVEKIEYYLSYFDTTLSYHSSRNFLTLEEAEEHKKMLATLPYRDIQIKEFRYYYEE